jgi:hypothetical protein
VAAAIQAAYDERRLDGESPRGALANVLMSTLEEFPDLDLYDLEGRAGAIRDRDLGIDDRREVTADVWREWGGDERAGRKAASKRSSNSGKTVRGVRYRGRERDRSADPYYLFTPANIVKAVEEKRLTPVDIAFASVLYQHVRRSERYKDKGRRITLRELAAKLHRDERSARRAVARMVGAGELIVESRADGNRNGAIYRFPPRTKVAEAIEI